MQMVFRRESFGEGIEGAAYQDVVPLENLLQRRRHVDVGYRVRKNQFRKCVQLFKEGGVNFRETIAVTACEGVFDEQGYIPWLACVFLFEFSVDCAKIRMENAFLHGPFAMGG